jgi:hypothetical protein
MPARFACCLAAAVAATAAFDAVAQAEPPLVVEGRVALQYRRRPQAVAACPDEEAFRERAADAFGFRDPFTPAGVDAPAGMRVEITRTPDDFLATVFAADAAGYSVSTERDTNCDTLVWRLGHRMGMAIFRASAAPASPPAKRFRLRYTRGPTECLSEVDFRRAVASQGDGVDRFYADGIETVSVTYEQLPSGQFRATIEHPGAKDGSEVKTHANCQTLGLKTAVSVYRFVPAPDLPTPPPPALPLSAKPEEPRPPAQPRVRPLLCLILSDENCMNVSMTALGMAIMTAGYTPDVGGGFSLGGEVRWEIISVGLFLRGVFPSPVVARTPIYPDKPSYEQAFDLSQWSAQLVPCARWKVFMGCAFGEVGALEAVNNQGAVSGVLVAVGPRVGVDVPINDRFSVFGFGEARFTPLVENLVFIRDPAGDPSATPANVKWEAPWASAGFAVGLAVHFK